MFRGREAKPVPLSRTRGVGSDRPEATIHTGKGDTSTLIGQCRGLVPPKGRRPVRGFARQVSVPENPERSKLVTYAGAGEVRALPHILHGTLEVVSVPVRLVAWLIVGHLSPNGLFVPRPMSSSS